MAEYGNRLKTWQMVELFVKDGVVSKASEIQNERDLLIFDHNISLLSYILVRVSA